MNHVMISDFAKDQEIDDYYVCVKKVLKQTKNGDGYISVTLSDRTGRIEGKMWKEAVAKCGDDFEQDKVVRIKGKISEYDNKMQIVIERAGNGDPSKYDLGWFLPQSPYPIADVLAEMDAILDEIQDAKLRDVVTVFKSNEKMYEEFKIAPGAVALHHAYIGGLAVHTLGVIKFAKSICALYPTLKKDVLLTASLFHDIGKMVENTWDLTFKRTSEGELIGHIIISRDILRECMAKVGLDAHTALNLEHCILSHHGHHEYGSPKLPSTREAYALHIADLADSRFEEYDRLIANLAPGESTEPIRFLDNVRLFNI